MTLARRMTAKIVGLAATLVVLAATSAWGLLTTSRSVRIARDEYTELGLIRIIDEHLMSIQTALAGGKPDEGRAGLAAAMHQVRTLIDFQDQQSRDIAPHEEEEREYLTTLESELGNALALLAGAATPAGPDAIPTHLDKAKALLEKLAREMDAATASAQLESHRALQATLVILTAVSLAAVAVTILINIAQYRSVVVPIRRLRDGVRTIASGQFDKRLDVTGGDDFAQLAQDFNQMAAELDDLYRDLERRVREKSRELVRSERLASVGFLAAGVAHEINSPLNIISGYAELTLRQIQKAIDGGADEDVGKALRIIRDESFRCKDIIEKLLTLSAGAERTHERVSLRHVVDEIATMLASLKQYRTRKVSVCLDQNDGLHVLGNETELKQVVLNLAINALEAVRPDVGEVRFEIAQANGTVRLAVSDNGCGLTADACEHVFEPFFTQRMGSEHRGLGLGLSITHAIIDSHGGRITVSSDGPGRGSRFLVELPAYNQDPDKP